MAPIGVGIVFIACAYANWRWVEGFTASQIGQRRAARLARNPFGNKIGGTVFLTAMGVLLIASGIARAI